MENLDNNADRVASAILPGPSSPQKRRARSSSSSSSSSSSQSSSSSSSSCGGNPKRSRRNKKKGGKSKRRSKRKVRKLAKEVRNLRRQMASQDNGQHVSTNFDYDAISLMSGISESRYGQMLDVERSNFSARSDQEFTLSLETKLKEPSMPKTPENYLKLLYDLQHLDKNDWNEIRYSDTQKLYNHSPGYTDIEMNEEVKAFDSPRHLVYADKAFAALTMCVLKQKEFLQGTLQELLQWARNSDSLNYDTLFQKVYELFSAGDFNRCSSDLLQIICGHRAEILQMRRDCVTKQAKDPLMKASLKKIPPTCTNLFNAEKFTAAVEKAGGVRKCFWPLKKVTIPLLSFGMVQGWLSPMISVLQSDDGPSPDPYTSSDISWMASVTYITAIIFGAPMGWLTDKYGRKLMTLVTTLSLIIYWQIKLLCLEPWALILARAVAGIPCSSCYIVLPIYLKEISDIDLRGALGSLLILNRNIGYLMSYVCADILSVNTMLWLGLLVPTVTFFIFLAMPETPEYLVKQGKVDEAKTVLAWLRGVSVMDRGVEQDIESIVRVDKQTQADTQSVTKIILQDKPTFKAFIITIIIKITQQFDGYLIVLIYAGFVFERASESISLKLSPNKQVMLIGVVQLLGSVVATCFVEKTGRKLLLVTTSFAVGVGMAILSAWFYMTSSGFWLPGWLPVLAMCLCIFADAAGFQPISYIIITDLFTFQLRGTVSAFANVCAKMSNFVQTKWFTIICELIGIHWTFLFFAIVCFIACFYTVIYFPETRQKSIDEIYSKLSGKVKKNDSRIEPVP